MPDTTSDTDRLLKRNRELVILNAIAGELNRPVALDHSLDTALGLVADLLDLETGWIFLLDETTGEPYPAAVRNLPPGLAGVPERMQGSCYCLDTFRAGDLAGAANVNVVTCSRLKWLIQGSENAGLRYHASIPLYAHGKRLGVLNVASTDWRELSDEDLRILHTIGDLVGIAVERARLFERSTRLGMAEERNRLARELHDTLAQGLAAVALRLETTDALLESNADVVDVRRNLRQALDQTRAVLTEARRSVLDLRAAPLEGKTLSEALQHLVDEFTDRTGIPVAFTPAEGLPSPDPRMEISLFRIAQEALTNVERHAAAQQVHVRLSIGTSESRLVIEDDGRGFDPDAVPEGHYGLIGMNERARLLGGTLTVESGDGSGTRVFVVVKG